MFYARVVFDSRSSTAERHPDVETARRWIEQERKARPKRFRFAQIYESTPDRRIVASCSVEGWHHDPQEVA